MKLSTCITQQQKNIIKQIVNTTKEKQGIDAMILVKKLILIATYGTMRKDKITLDDFLTMLHEHICIKKKLVQTFWRLNHKADLQFEKFFGIKYQLIYYGTQNEIEKELIDMMLQPSISPLDTIQATYLNFRSYIRDEYKDIFNQMFMKK